MGAALLSKQGLAPTQQRVIDRIRRSTVRATKMIADLLDFTQARLGRALSATLASIALHEVVGDALEELRLAHPQRSLVHVSRGEGSCSGDASRLTQLVGNLVSNAAAYGDPGGPITVTSTIAEACCSIAVHNTGPPIPAALQATLFEPLARGVSGQSEARSIGLGLFIVREIARAHDGTVQVTSSTEAGTTFELSWPTTLGPVVD
jgi:sigma-B regulation protein RsbU (phosphoserine phosphatase)